MKKLPVQRFINGIAEKILTQNYWGERQLTNSSVVLRKRLRNAVDSDRYGVFSPSTGVWTDDFDTSSLYSLNIVTPTVRTNTSAMITANVKIETGPRFEKDMTSQAASDVAAAILERWDRQQWTSFLEEHIAEEQQVGPGVFVRERFNPNLKRSHTLPQWEDVDVELPGTALCTECGHENPVTAIAKMFGDGDEQDETQENPQEEAQESPEQEGQEEQSEPQDEITNGTNCEVCGATTVLSQLPTSIKSSVPTGHKEFSSGATETKVFSFFEFRVDDQQTSGGHLENAKWFEHHYLVNRDEIELEYPELSESLDVNSNWSYSVRWQQALRRNRRAPVESNTESVIEECEVRDIFLTPAMYLNTEVETDFELKDADGKVCFSVATGKTFADAKYQGDAFDEPPVLCFRLVGTTLLDIFPCDFRKEYAYITFFANPSCFWGLFLTDLTILQDIINTVLTLQMFHIRRNAITSIVYNRASFDSEAFSEDIIPTKEDIPPDIPISQQFGIIPALTLSREPMQMLTTIMEMKQDVTLATPALMGQAQPNEPYAAQLLQKQSSLGLLAPSGISKATAKRKLAIQHLKYAQTYWTDEDTQEFLKLNAEWDEDTVESFLNCSIDNDLIIDYQEGTEVPQSLIEREVRVNKLFSDIVNLAGLAPQLVKPDLINAVFAQMIQASGVDFDFDNNQSNLKLAEARYDNLKHLVELAPVDGNDHRSQILAVQTMMQLPDFQPFPTENFDVITEFYTDKAIAEMSNDEPNYLMVRALYALIELEHNAQTMAAQKVTAMQMAAQAPMMQAQQQAMAQQQQGEAQQQQQQQQADAQQSQQDRIQDVQAEGAKQLVQTQKVQADQSHQADLQENQQGHQERLQQGQQRHEINLKAIDLLNQNVERKHKEMLARQKPKPQKAGAK